MEIKEYLEEKGCSVRDRGVDHISTHCVFCNEEDTKQGRLYINNDENSDKYGVYFCFLCGSKGGINQLRAHFGDEPLDIDNYVEANPIVDIAAQYYFEKLLENKEAYNYLTKDRGLSDETIVRARLGWADGSLCTHLLQKGFTAEEIQDTKLVNKYGEDTFDSHIIFPYMEYGRAIQLRGKPIGGKTMSTSQPQALPYGLDSMIGEDTVIIAEGEIDTLTLQQFGYPCIGVPGVHTFKEGWEEYLEGIKRIYIMFDPDKDGKAGAEKLATRLGTRVRVVELPKAKVDVNEYFVKYGKEKEDFDYLIRKAKGGILISVDECYEEWLDVEGNPDNKGLLFGYDALDNAFERSLMVGQVMSMIARTGNGKTIFTINLLQRMKLMKPDIKILFLSLEQTRNEWFERAYRINNFYYPGMTPLENRDFWKNNIYIIDKNRVSEDQLVDSIEQFQYEMGEIPDLVVVDYLGYYARSFPGTSDKEKVSAAIMGGKEIAKEYKTRMFFPHQANRTNQLGTRLSVDQAKDAATVEETSDIMLTLWRPDQHEGATPEDSGKVMQEIVKTRQGGFGTLISYVYCPLTFAMIPTSDILYAQAIAERQYAMAGDSFEQAVERHITGNMNI
jgi:5S rRNA maturation endonuclease (ribonuclease M5)